MILLYLILPLSLLVATGFVIAFVWAARDDQYEDLDTPPIRMLHEDPPLREAAEGPAGDASDRGVANG